MTLGNYWLILYNKNTIFSMNVKFSNEVKNVYYDKITGQLTRAILTLNIDKFIINDYIDNMKPVLYMVNLITDGIEFE